MRKIILVGHCGPDSHMLRSAISRAVPGAATAMVNDGQSLSQHLAADALLLINRVLDGNFVTQSGTELIQTLIGQGNSPSMMLISNLADAQDHAVSLGAKRGFGKSQLYHDATTTILREAISMNGAILS